MALDLNNNTAKGLYILVDIDGKGKGLLARRNIEPGTLLMADTTCLEIRHDIMLKERVARNMWSGWDMIVPWIEVILAMLLLVITYHIWPIAAAGLVLLVWQRVSSHLEATKSAILFKLSWNTLIKQVESLNCDVKREFSALENVFPHSAAYQHWLGIFCTNSFQLGESGKSGLFLSVSRLNHSCRANCDYSIEHGCLEVRTARQVRAGEELTICYNNFLEEDGPVVKSERKEYLLWAYRFSCSCEDCSLMGNMSRINDHMRKRLVKLRKDWTITQDFRQERQIVDEQIRLLSKLDSCGKTEYMLQAVECGWETEKNNWEHMNTHGVQFEKKIAAERVAVLAQLGGKLSKTLSGLHSQRSREWEERAQQMK